MNVWILDKSQLFREILSTYFKNDHDSEIEISWHTDQPETLLEKLYQETPDILLTDYLPGAQAAIELTTKVKSIAGNCKILYLTNHMDNHVAVNLIRAGASGYLIKDLNVADLKNAVNFIYNHEDPYITDFLAQALFSLNVPVNSVKKSITLPFQFTKREYQILTLIYQELTSTEIADRLNISVRTVEGHRQNLIGKAGVKNTVGLIKFMVKHSMVPVAA